MKFDEDLSCFCFLPFNQTFQPCGQKSTESSNNTCSNTSSPVSCGEDAAIENLSEAASKFSHHRRPKASCRLKRKKASRSDSSSSCSSARTSSLRLRSHGISSRSRCTSSDDSFSSSSQTFSPKSLLLLKRKASNNSYYCNFCIERKTRRTTLFKQIEGFNSFSNHMIGLHSTMVIITGNTGMQAGSRCNSVLSSATWSKSTDAVLQPQFSKLPPSSSSSDYNDSPSSDDTDLPSPALSSPPQDANTQTEDEEDEEYTSPDNFGIPTSVIDQQITEIPPDIDEWFQNVEIPDINEYKDIGIQTDPIICHCGSSNVHYESEFPLNLIIRKE